MADISCLPVLPPGRVSKESMLCFDSVNHIFEDLYYKLCKFLSLDEWLRLDHGYLFFLYKYDLIKTMRETSFYPYSTASSSSSSASSSQPPSIFPPLPLPPPPPLPTLNLLLFFLHCLFFPLLKLLLSISFYFSFTASSSPSSSSSSQSPSISPPLPLRPPPHPPPLNLLSLLYCFFLSSLPF